MEGKIYVCCRDQIVRLHDLNGDGETDFYENFNNDHQVTEHFHEFAMDLQTDADGNFYYAKAARHGLPALVPHHGTLLKVKQRRQPHRDPGHRVPRSQRRLPQSRRHVLPLRPGGVLDAQEPDQLVKRGGFYGNMWGYTDVTDPSDSAMEQPVCWLTNAFDRSPAQLLWVDSKNPAWRPLAGSLLCLSYGYGKIFVVPHETVAGQMQGGECALPIPRFPTGVMRGRFHPGNGQLYACGLFAWAGDQTQPGGFYRVRATGKPMFLPVGLSARKDGMAITFTDPLDPETATDPTRYRRPRPGRSSGPSTTARITSTSSLLRDHRRTPLGRWPHRRPRDPGIAPTRCMEITYRIKGTAGEPVEGVIHNTIHQLQPARAESRQASASLQTARKALIAQRFLAEGCNLRRPLHTIATPKPEVMLERPRLQELRLPHDWLSSRVLNRFHRFRVLVPTRSFLSTSRCFCNEAGF